MFKRLFKFCWEKDTSVANRVTPQREEIMKKNKAKNRTL